MKKWLQNLSGAVMASLLAITLNGKAYAEDPPPVPTEAPTEVVETAPEPAPAPAPAPEPAPAPAPVVVEAAPAVAQTAPVVAEPAPAPAPAPAAEAAPVASAAPTAAASAPAPAPASAASEAPTASTEAPVAAPKVAVATSEAPGTIEASAAVAETPVVAESAPAADQLVVPEVPTAAEASAVDAKTAVETPDVDTVISEMPEEIPAEAPTQAVETQTAEKEKIAEPEEPAVKGKAQQAVDETVLEDNNEDNNKEPVQEINAKNASSDNSEKLTSLKKLSLTKDVLSSDGESGAAANLISAQENSENTGSLEEKEEEQSEEQLEEQPEEPLIKLAKRGITADESGIDEGEGETKAAATRGTGGEDANTQTSQNGVFSQNADGSYVLVNHSGTESLSANGDITVLAAGLNHITSISGTGKVIIAGTGILLVDSLQGDLELLTFTDIYEQGSVAVFVKDGDRYVLANGSVPGLLDEQYEVTDATLVMPANTSLRIFGTGAVSKNNGSGILYYHGYDVSDGKVEDVDKYHAVESIGKLTIAQQAALIVEKGASIVLENLYSLGGTSTYDDTRYPELNVSEGGTLTVDGSIGNGGFVTITGTSQTLSGKGSLKAKRITVSAPAAVNGSKVSLSASQLYLNGSGTVENLKVSDSLIIPASSSVKMTGLVSTGSNLIDTPDAFEVGIASVDGTLTFRTASSYSDYSNDMMAIVKGTVGKNGVARITGSGTLHFESGIYSLAKGTRLEGIQIDDSNAAIVYDYAEHANAVTTSEIPLIMQPDNVPVPEITTEGVMIRIVAAKVTERSIKRAGKKIEINSRYNSSSFLAENSDNGLVLNLYELMLHLQSLNIPASYVDLLYKSADGTLYSAFYNYSQVGDKNNPMTVAADDICLIRAFTLTKTFTSDPAISGTQTGTLFTGSGILGGEGAGSVRIGRPSYSDNTEPKPISRPVFTSAPAVVPKTEDDAEEPEPEPLTAEIEKIPEEVPAVWVEIAPAAAAASATAPPTEMQYVLLALEGEETLEEMGGRATVSMEYTPPAEYVGKRLYVVFRNEDGTLTAIRATYSNITGLLRFITDRLGTFMIVGFDFDGEEFSEEFYEALAQIPELKDLVFAEYSPV